MPQEHIQRLKTDKRFEQLELDDGTLAELRSVRDDLSGRSQVRSTGSGRPSVSGGAVLLFSGVSGTGKTMAAEALANELDLDLYRIDLSQVVSKYIGETEKNLAQVFEAAERAGAILLFDEADVLFGRRTEVKDAHDRYANLEVSYLLQRIEPHDGTVILATNLKENIDEAFARRMRYVIRFPYPDEAERPEVWRSP